MSGLEISEELEMNFHTVYYHIKTSGVKRRSLKEASDLAKSNGRIKTGDKSTSWKGGNNNGYKWVHHNGKRMPEQYIVMEELIGRPVKKGEVVHHKNGDRADNRVENLDLMTKSEHSSLHNPKGKKLKQETIEKMRKRMSGKHRKEDHWQWRKDITKDVLIDALRKFNTKTEASEYLGMSIDNIKKREKYYGIYRNNAKSLTKYKILNTLNKNCTLKRSAEVLGVNTLTLCRRIKKYEIDYKKELKNGKRI